MNESLVDIRPILKPTVLFLDGSVGRHLVRVYEGGAFTGDPTAYIMRNGCLIWVKPGESVEWIEVGVKS